MKYKMSFITIGYIEWRKGQDLLLDAIEQLPDSISDETEFILIGQDTSVLAHKIKDRVGRMQNVEMPGAVSREEVHKLLEKADVLICPSREDPMPTVCAEAMMHRLPCIVSDATGTAAYIRDGLDGMIFESENVSELKDKILWCVQHKPEVKEMGEKAYEIYEKMFSTDAFERNLLKYVDEALSWNA